MKIYILGAGVLGKFIIDIIESRVDMEIGGFFDDNYPSLINVFGYPVLGKILDLDSSRNRYIAIGVGSPIFRMRLCVEILARGFVLPVIAHSSAIISKHSMVNQGGIIGPNTSILNGSILGDGACILSHVSINQNVNIGSYSLIGAGVVVGNNVSVGEGSHLHLSSRIGSNQVIEPWSEVK